MDDKERRDEYLGRRWEKPLRPPDDPVGTQRVVLALDYMQWAADQFIRQSECLRAHLQLPCRSEEEGQEYNDIVAVFTHLMNLHEGIQIMQAIIVNNADELDRALIARDIAARKYGVALNVVVEDGKIGLQEVDTTVPRNVEEWLHGK